MSLFANDLNRGTTVTSGIDHEDYDDFYNYLKALADDFFPFPGYNQYQDEILYETLEAFLIDDRLNVIIEGPTGIGKSAINVTVSQVLSVVAQKQSQLEEHFGVTLRHLNNGSAFYTTPQKSLRNQLADDGDLQHALSMLKARADYQCGAGDGSCADCFIKKDPDMSCRDEPDCTYWNALMDAIDSPLAVLTFARLIIDNYVPPSDDKGQLSFKDRDLIIVDEGHNSEGQSASMFAGFTLSPWNLPPEVYGDAGEKIDWETDRFADAEEIIHEIKIRADNFIQQKEDLQQYEAQVEQCENMLRKMEYAMKTHAEGEGWVINVDQVKKKESRGKTKKIQVQPVRVNGFLSKFVWSRGRRRLITSATIPFRGNVGKWGRRIGLGEDPKLISKPTPFPEEHRLIHLNEMVGPMDSDNEDDNWPDAMDAIEEIASHHEGEKGVIHSVSYSRAERVRDSLGTDNLMIDEQEKETDAMITKWQNSDKDIFVSPAMTEGVDLFEDRCRWQCLLKVPFLFMGDSRVNYLCFEEHEWNWYMEEAGIDIIQSVGRAVRGPEPEEAASFYVIDEKFEDVMYKTSPPDYFVEAVRDDPPEHWENPKVAPWR
jgi:ATP-dependent DNA helicase DinG